MVKIAEIVTEREDEWNPRCLFSAEDLRNAISELVLASADEYPRPDTCLGDLSSIAKIQAPDRRPSSVCDTELSVYHQLYPTSEQIKIFADVKYFFAIACGGGLCDEGRARAVAEAANDILIADYCEAADPSSLKRLQQVGGAATAFLKLCHLAGVVTDWQFNNTVAIIIQFRTLGYYRGHSRPLLPSGVYGSRMTSLLAPRHIDLAIYIGVMVASLGTGEEITRDQYELLVEACCFINDLIDFRSDTMRKVRENVILRGIRGNFCEHMDGLISSCLRLSANAIRSSRVSALVVMG
ncbi:hypothetical protein N7520_008564 [Penicillium odoratum]|uniref:uncharacterized protein n=1 Tax=Penicillium odoratum TaxID=1167516 RepID=UPI002549B47C|nr:uncharacterized protein N7520_008564 [Penicillium odoratum]KAJ5751647.1 hypothetical protein N7520_008564 [Penicillium odoratum]